MLRTPYYLIDMAALDANLAILNDIKKQTGCKILLAQKAFSAFAVYPQIAQVLDGTTSSGLYEARLGATRFGKETHVYAPAFREDEIEEICSYAKHIVFNSPAQVRKYGARAKALGCQIGLRLNPECSTQDGHAQYDPCAPFSRLGTTVAQLDNEILSLLDGIHMHTLCEQNSDALAVTVEALINNFDSVLSGVKWINLGGGHHITRQDYDRSLLIKTIQMLKDRYHAEIYLEPGEAVVLNAGTLVASVLDIVHNGMDIVILDTSAACHMPDVLEMPYRPNVRQADLPDRLAHTYRLTGPTCLAGDIIGDYSFDHALQIGDQVIFEDMALYTMVKNNTFNGMPLPSIALQNQDGTVQLVRQFGYNDFEGRLS